MPGPDRPQIDRIVGERTPWASRIAFLAGGEVVELWVEGADRPSQLGGIAVARVTAVNAALGTSVVAIPGGEALLTDGDTAEGGIVTVQVVRDAQAGKRAVARRAVELADGPVLLTPGKPGVGLSSAITGKGRRAALRAALQAVVPGDIGVLVRSAGSDRPPEELAGVAEALVARWHAIQTGARRVASPPAWVEPPPPVFDAARALAHGVEPEIDDSGRLFESCCAGEALDAALARRVPLGGGGELVFDAAEAAVLVDVNLPDGGGRNRLARAGDAAEAALRQLRLRGLRGTVLLDLPRIGDRQARTQLLARVAAAAARDPGPASVLGWTPGGMLELVREGARRPLAEEMLERPAEPVPSPRAAAWAALAGLRREAVRVARPRLRVAPAVAGWLSGAGAPIFEAERTRLGHLALRADPGLAREAFRVESDD